MEIRSFLNSDVPQLVGLWNRQVAAPGRLPAVSAAMLETHVFSKAYFEPAGLVLAEANNSLVGAALCGFAPNSSGANLERRIGILSHAIVEDPTAEIWSSVWNQSVAYFLSQGTETVFWGSRFPESPFLAGFCGGTFVPGLSLDEAAQWDRLRQSGFSESGQVDILKLEIESFKPPVDRRVVMAKRSFDVRLTIDPLPENWWQHNIGAFRHQLDFRMVERKSNRVCGLVSFSNSRPQDAGWDSRYMGITQIMIHDALQRNGLGQAMLIDAIKDLGQRGVAEIEAQVPRSIAACQSMLRKIGFRPWYSARQAVCQMGQSV